MIGMATGVMVLNCWKALDEFGSITTGEQHYAHPCVGAYIFDPHELHSPYLHELQATRSCEILMFVTGLLSLMRF